jgi:hypothetical protein
MLPLIQVDGCNRLNSALLEAVLPHHEAASERPAGDASEPEVLWCGQPFAIRAACDDTDGLHRRGFRKGAGLRHRYSTIAVVL